MTSLFRIAVSSACALTTAAATAASQGPPSWDQSAARAIVTSAADAADSVYVFPDKGRALADSIRRYAGAGRYDGLSSAAELASRLTSDMRRITGDLHFQLMTPAGAGPIRRVVPGGGGPGGMSPMAERERRANYFFTRFELLPGGVAYIRLDQFPLSVDSARRVAGAVMAMAATADAVILDLRRNPGGGEGLNQILSSHFYPADTTRVLYQRTFRGGGQAVTTPVLADLSGPRILTAPLFILTSRRTGSAAENMAYHLQAARRATVVGERTAGAANSSRPVSVAHGFTLVVPFARVISPATGTNWEGVGVQPDVAVAPEVALDVAHLHALRSLAAKASAPNPSRDRAIGVLEVKTGATKPAPKLQEVVGSYGDWTVTASGSDLLLKRAATGASFRATAIAADRFAVLDEPDVQFEFLRTDNRVTALRVLGPSGEWITVPR